MNALLVGRKARFFNSASGQYESFLEVSTRLLGREDPCAIGAIEATILFAILGVSFDGEAAIHARPDQEFLVIDARMNAYADSDNPDRVFERMRPGPTDAVLPYVEAVARQAVVMRQTERGAAAGAGSELRLRQLLEFITYAAEPIRIQFYLHARADVIEGAIGTALAEGSEQRLFRNAERALYPSVERMRWLREQPPPAILAALDPIVDRWFQTTVVPAIRRSLTDNPFAAYWFFVQTGGVVAAGPVYSGAHVQVLHPLFALTEIAGLGMSDALARFESARVPADFIAQHAALESAFTELTLSHDEVMAAVADARISPAVARRLGEFMTAASASSPASSLDVYGRIIRDASRISGRLDRDVLAAAIDVLSRAKATHLDQQIHRIVVSSPARDPRLEAYLRTAAALMVELEHRQAAESAFRQGTSGAAVGWLLSQFFIGGSVPIALWTPGGVAGPEFAQLVDDLAPKNRDSGDNYAGKPLSDVELVHDGREYHAALVRVIDSAKNFINISSFDWGTDAGGRDIAYRLMAKKLGIEGANYSRFLATFERGLPMDPSQESPVPFYDIPTTRIKDLLVTYFILTTDQPEVASAREALRAAGASLECKTVMTCGDLEPLREHTRAPFNGRQPAAADRAWLAYQRIEALFSDRPPALDRVHPRRALRDYCEDPDALRRFVRRFGPRRVDRPEEPLDINIVTDAKRNLSNLHFGDRSQLFPYFVTEPIRDIFFMLLEFDIRVMLWKGGMEFPWHVGPVPVPGRKFLGFIPMPFVPWPWLGRIGGTWAGPVTSVFLQYLLATDVRIWWGMVNHTKSWSNESMALESGMGMASKYFNDFDEYQTWHDAGVIVRGGPVDDVNDHFVQVFNEARKNNTGLPSSRGIRIPRLGYEDYRSVDVDPPDERPDEHRSWVVTTHPEQGDSNYRGVFVAALAAARHNIYIENPFFSDPLIARMLIHKAREFRGRVNCAGLASHECAVRTRDAVRIHLVVPDVSDKPVVDAVGTADFDQMLHVGIKVHRWHPDSGWSASRMLHSKVWLVDYEPGGGGLVYVGAANTTQRSHLADNEAGILSNDPKFARQVYERIFEPDITNDSRLESEQSFHVVWSSSRVVRANRWLRRLLVELFWFI